MSHRARLPEALSQAEDRLRSIRRHVSDPKHLPPAVGVGLSGGGIRSATFCLGVFQALARLRLLGSIDYLSTVSGGGYFGSFFGRLFTRTYVEGVDDVATMLEDRETAAEGRTLPPGVLRWLRENGRYLSPRGAGDLMQMLAGILRNWVALHVSLLSLVALAAILVVAVRAWAEGSLPDGAAAFARPVPLPGGWGLWLSPWWILPAAIFVFGAFPAGAAYWLLEWPSAQSVAKRTMVSFGWVAVVLVPAAAVGWIELRLRRSGAIGGWLARDVDEAFVVFLLVASLVVVLIRIWSLAVAETAYSGRWKPSPRQVPPILPTLLFAAILVWRFAVGDETTTVFGGLLLLAVGLAWAAARIVLPSSGRAAETAEEKKERSAPVYRDALARNRLTTWLRVALFATAGSLAIVVVDSIGESLYRGSSIGGGGGNEVRLVTIVSAVAALLGPAAKVLPLILGRRKKRRGAVFLDAVLGIVAIVVVAILLTGVFGLAHAVRWGFGPAAPPGAQAPEGQTTWLVVTIAMLLLYALLCGATWSFLNSSSQLPFYKARLARAYLGASNPRRVGTGVAEGEEGGVGQVVPGDDVGLLEYFGVPRADGDAFFGTDDTAFRRGAPLHLINVTINETKGGKSQVQQQDRKGLGMCLGPCGIHAGVEDHLVFDRDTAASTGPSTAWGNPGPWIPVRSEPATAERSRFLIDTTSGKAWASLEPLTLGHWIAISGAAFSTGTGYRTSLGLSLLAGIGNVRLGYWWDSRRLASWMGNVLLWVPRRVFAVQSYLLQEFLARFPGTSRRHWYLSDGGHFENLGGYELIRRRLPLIVLVDAEADPNFEFGGLSNLVRKARIDFDAEVRFLDAQELDGILSNQERTKIGTLDELRRGRWEADPGSDPPRYSRRHAALAVVTYHDSDRRSLLLYVKASMTGDEPIDVRQYHVEHEAFPHEPTSDQFFDEAQWESYRKLGEHIGTELFGAASKWDPAGFKGSSL
ncbi:MAG TPA: hypothetical protein VF139_00500, partial [Candidatus Polarisedimenticolaceae bacterium]